MSDGNEFSQKCQVKIALLEEGMAEVKREVSEIRDDHKILHQMNTNIEIIALGNKHQNEKIDIIARTQINQGKEIKEIKEKPMKDWDKVKWTIITVVCTSLTMYVLSQLPKFIESLG